MFADEYALRTTWTTSQVCREWRDSLLDAPFLWARLIHLDILYKEWNHVWRNELIVRSGAAPLWIKFDSDPMFYCRKPGTITVRVESIVHFFQRIVKENWHRIQKLVINRDGWNSVITPSMLCYPAPYLQNLTAGVENQIVNTDGSDKYRSITPLFGNHAPSLRVLKLRGCTVDYQALWLSQLQILHLEGRYNIGDLLAVLVATHSLRNAQFILEGHDDLASPIPNVHLPHLESLKLHVELPHQAVTLLNHTSIPTNCFLTVLTDYDHMSPINATEYMPLISAFSPYVRLHLQSRKSNSILELDSSYICRIIWKCMGSPGECSEVGIRILLPETVVQSVFEMVLKSLSVLELSSVAEVRFYGWKKSDHPCSTSVREFFRGLTSLHTLCSDTAALENITEFQEDIHAAGQSSIILPSLSIVNLELYEPFLDHETAAFFLSRLRNGYPLHILNLSLEDSEALYTLPNLDALYEVKGLKVTYRLMTTGDICEYICGSDGSVQEIDDMV